MDNGGSRRLSLRQYTYITLIKLKIYIAYFSFHEQCNVLAGNSSLFLSWRKRNIEQQIEVTQLLPRVTQYTC